MKSSTLLYTALALSLTWFGCLPKTTGDAVFVDEAGILTDPELLDLEDQPEGAACGSTDNCAQDLRCVKRDYGQLCASTCQTNAQCDSNTCQDAFGDDIGWCVLGEELQTDPPERDLDAPDPVEPSSSISCGALLETQQWQLLNKDRVANGLNPLCCMESLSDVARAHSRDMAQRNYFDHTSPEGTQPWDRMKSAGVTGWTMAAENIAYGQDSPEAVQEAWMNSPGHRQNILDPGLTHVGVGQVYHDGTPFWTQLFATFPDLSCQL